MAFTKRGHSLNAGFLVLVNCLNKCETAFFTFSHGVCKSSIISKAMGSPSFGMGWFQMILKSILSTILLKFDLIIKLTFIKLLRVYTQFLWERVNFLPTIINWHLIATSFLYETNSLVVYDFKHFLKLFSLKKSILPPTGMILDHETKFQRKILMHSSNQIIWRLNSKDLHNFKGDKYFDQVLLQREAKKQRRNHTLCYTFLCKYI